MPARLGFFVASLVIVILLWPGRRVLGLRVGGKSNWETQPHAGPKLGRVVLAEIQRVTAPGGSSTAGKVSSSQHADALASSPEPVLRELLGAYSRALEAASDPPASFAPAGGWIARTLSGLGSRRRPTFGAHGWMARHIRRN